MSDSKRDEKSKQGQAGLSVSAAAAALATTTITDHQSPGQSDTKTDVPPIHKVAEFKLDAKQVSNGHLICTLSDRWLVVGSYVELVNGLPSYLSSFTLIDYQKQVSHIINDLTYFSFAKSSSVKLKKLILPISDTVFGIFLNNWKFLIIDPENPTQPQTTLQIPNDVIDDIKDELALGWKLVAIPNAPHCFVFVGEKDCFIINAENNKWERFFACWVPLTTRAAQRDLDVNVNSKGVLTLTYFADDGSGNGKHIQKIYAVNWKKLSYKDIASSEYPRCKNKDGSANIVKCHGFAPANEIYLLFDDRLHIMRGDQLKIIYFPANATRTTLGWLPTNNILFRIYPPGQNPYFEEGMIQGSKYIDFKKISDDPLKGAACLIDRNGNLISVTRTPEAVTCSRYQFQSVLDYQNQLPQFVLNEAQEKLVRLLMSSALNSMPLELIKLIALYAVTSTFQTPQKTDRFTIPLREDITLETSQAMYTLYESLIRTIFNPSLFGLSMQDAAMQKVTLQHFVDLLKDTKKTWRACVQEVLIEMDKPLRAIAEKIPELAKTIQQIDLEKDAKAKSAVVPRKIK